MEKLKGDTNRESIELYLVSEEGMVELTDQQKKLLKRWEYADELIRIQEIRSRETIAQLIMKRFQVGRTTAFQDIVNAEGVFASSTPLNKKYRVGLRIEFLERKIDELYGNVKQFEPDPDAPEDPEDPFAKIGRIQLNEEYITQAAQLEKVLQKYYQIYPDTAPVKSPRITVYNIQNNVLPAPGVSVEDAIERARKMINLNPREDGGANTGS
jgi:hypothetical protein